VFAPPTTFEEARAKVNVAIGAYTSAIVDLGAAIGMELLMQSRKIDEKIDKLSNRFEDLSLFLESRFTGSTKYLRKF
jgi:hypothetical protein